MVLGLGALRAQLNDCEALLSKTRLIDHRTYTPSYNTLSPAALRVKNYIDQYKALVAGSMYDFMLTDGSLIQYQLTGGRGEQYSMSFIDCPLLINSTDSQSGPDMHVAYDRLEDPLAQAEAKGYFTPIRFDYSPSDYKPGQHPAAHLHFGHQSNVRVFATRLLTPLSFTLLVVRQCYPTAWTIAKGIREFHTWARQIRDALDRVPAEFFSAQDQWEHRLE